MGEVLEYRGIFDFADTNSFFVCSAMRKTKRLVITDAREG